MIKRVLQLVVFTVVLNTAARENPAPYATIVIPDVPHELQRPDFCGEACAAMAIRKLGQDVDQDYIFDRSGLMPEAARGLRANELADTLARIGFDVGPVFTPVGENEDLERHFTRLHDDLLTHIPSIVLMHTSESDPTEHFRLVTGYDAEDDAVIYHDPALENGAYRRMDRSLFLGLWAIEIENQWGTVRIRMAQGDLEYGEAATDLTAADYAQHLMALKGRIPDGFIVRIEAPFVIVSDCIREEVEDYRVRVVRQVVNLLRRDFFLKDPDRIVDIWMLQDERSYRFHSNSVFGVDPETPYGFYSPAHDSIILDISTGGGTLVHEIIHPFMDANFQEAPPWFDEGLAALFERPTRKDGHLQGLVNWRLPGLQNAIRARLLPSLIALTHQNARQFYEEDPGINYAHARYLLYYLQEKGLLQDFYHAFYQNRHFDPTGLSTLQSLLQVDSLSAFESRFRTWALLLDANDA